MLQSIAMIIIVGILAGELCKKIKFPALFGMILTGIITGPFVLNLIDGSILDISSQIRKIALVIILTRAGLTLNIEDLKKVGRPAILMCFLPATLEMLGMILIAPALLGISVKDAAVMGAVVAAVSPAVIVPKMIKLIEDGYGTKESIPQMILAGASVDDVFVIVMFTVFMGFAQGEKMNVLSIVNIPLSIVTGVLVGIMVGLAMAFIFSKFHVRDTVKAAILLSVFLLLVGLEDALPDFIPYASLISVMFTGIAMQKKGKDITVRLSGKFNKLWSVAEVFLFVLVGATVDIKYAVAAGFKPLLLIFIVLIFRMSGVYLCLLKTELRNKERGFCLVAYMPKATVQAAIGGLPLAAGLASGNIILTVAVLSILITAPLGAFLIDLTYKKCLNIEKVVE